MANAIYRFVMATFICDISAIKYWFGDREPWPLPSLLAEVPSFSKPVASWRDLPMDQLGSLGISLEVGERLHLAVPEQRMMRHTKRIATHLRANPPPGTFIRLSRDVYMESPVSALMRCGSAFSDGELAKLLYQLVGPFCLSGGRTVSCEPLMTMADIYKFFAGASGAHGVKRLRSLLPYIAPGAASMRECEVGVLLFLPPRMGGRGLPVPLLNHRVAPQVAALDITRFADYLWKVYKLILEYDSDEFHVGADKIGMDAARRTQLQVEGYEVVTLTNYQLKRKAEFEDVVGRLMQAMGLKPKTGLIPDFSARESQLRREVLGIDWLE